VRAEESKEASLHGVKMQFKRCIIYYKPLNRTLHPICDTMQIFGWPNLFAWGTGQIHLLERLVNKLGQRSNEVHFSKQPHICMPISDQIFDPPNIQLAPWKCCLKLKTMDFSYKNCLQFIGVIFDLRYLLYKNINCVFFENF